ncbi:hypothetical protein HYPSUDRAFT_49138 [Hypholoma sublateritium FD-334 SS-4]|uniref:BTB domain-containing protein n=1 Tax=Hypholoma sublateritium (strain FD-334 SS-4) TaxID=945553 RepID=A0A0D2KIM4_HYPSF|nr:hypothetical protein HYPSUDRAFT_49138 [Hypholoma sublateritium FD-334 SS-4]
MADGDVTILVSDTIFKVHRHIISRDGSTFADMFSSDLQDFEDDAFQQEGCTDEKPIQLQGDNVDEFRDLLWCLYALPQEISTSMSPQADIIKVANVLRMTHKYHFITTECWATTTITKYLQHQLPFPLPTDALVRISEVAVLCGDASLLEVIRRKWRGLIGENEQLALALTTTERLGLRDLQGLAYQAMLLQGRHVWEKEKLLTRDQRIRLLSGYHNISTYSTKIKDEPPLFEHLNGCPEVSSCQDDWESLWSDVNTLQAYKDCIWEKVPLFTATSEFDLVNRSMMLVSILQAMYDQPAMFAPFSLAKLPCATAALKATIVFSHELQMNMMDFFEDVN